MNDFLTLVGAIVRAYVTQHHSEMLDEMYDHDRDYINHVLKGWWVLDDSAGWAWWLGVYSRCPVSHNPWEFPYCDLDAPLPDADFSGWLA
jgi:hypothetical protein